MHSARHINRNSRLKSAVLCSTALLLVATAATQANAQCAVRNTYPFGGAFIFPPGSTVGTTMSPSFMAAGSAAVTSMVSAVNTVNTAFLTQTSAFIGSPANANPNEFFGGVWERTVAGEVTEKSTSAATSSLSYLPANGGPFTNIANSTANCNSTVQVNYGGAQTGADIARLKIFDGETNVHFGVTAGYVGASAHDVSGNGVQSSTAPVPGITGNPFLIAPLPSDFGGTFHVPFVGAYAALTRGGFFVDAQVLGTFYQMDLESNTAGMFGQRLNAQALSVNSNIGYHYDTGWNNWFIEPSAGVSWSRLQVDPLSVAGTFPLAQTSLLPTIPGAILPVPGQLGAYAFPNTTIQINDIDSTLGRVGVRVGTTATFGNLAITPFATAAIWHEFAGNVTATAAGLTGNITNGFPPGAAVGSPVQPLQNTGALSVSRVGTYGQLGGGFAWQYIGTGWLGYFRVDVRDGDNIQAVGFNTGIRYQFDPALVVPTGIFKAPVKAPVPVVEQAYWGGFYGGFFGEGGFGQTDWTWVTTPGGATNPRMGGAMGGLDAGWNYQGGPLVLGVEADGAIGGFAGGRNCSNVSTFTAATPGMPNLNVPANMGTGNSFWTCNEDARWMATATARAGYAWDRALFFVKGGAAWIKDDYTGMCNTLPRSAVLFNCAASPTSTVAIAGATASDRRTGWTVGAGFEYMLAKYWSAKAEYDYADFGTRREFFTDGEVADIKKTVNTVKIGVNYHFGWEPAPVVTKY